jgi:hypothetical protein
MSVYKAINAVQAALAKTGIAKDRTNSQGSGYKFRGIDDVYNAIAPLLAEHGLCILPRMLARTCEDRLTKAGGNLFYVTVEAEFDVVSALDGSKHTIRTFGEAMDSGDKATNKAMSAAYKYAAFQMFAIPTEGDNDADGHSHEVAGRQAQQGAKQPAQDDSPKARAARLAAGILNGDAEGAAQFLSALPEADTNKIWAHLDAETQKRITAAWPVAA